MELNIQDKLCQAIKKKSVVKFKYDDDLSFREVEPYAVYYVESTKNTLLYSTMIKKNNQAIKPEPRDFNLDKIHCLELVDLLFKPEVGFTISKLNGCSRVICSINGF